MNSSCVKPAARNVRNASAISPAEPVIALPNMPVYSAAARGATTTPAERPTVAGSRPTSAQAASKGSDPRAELADVAALRRVAAPDVGEAGRVAVALRAVAGDQDRDATRARARRELLQVAGHVVVPVEVRATGAQERDDDLERLLEPLVDVVLGQAEAVRSAPGVAGSETADEPAAADLVDRRGRLGDDPGVAVQGGRTHVPTLIRDVTAAIAAGIATPSQKP